MARRTFLSALILLGLSACQREEGISVAHTSNGTEFSVIGEGGKLACIDRITVGELHGHDVFIQWQLKLPYEQMIDHRGQCANQFTYGVAHDGYEMRFHDRKPLEPGKTYQVTAHERG